MGKRIIRFSQFYFDEMISGIEIIPKGTKVLGMKQDTWRGFVELLVEHDVFSEIGEGDRIQEATIIATKYEDGSVTVKYEDPPSVKTFLLEKYSSEEIADHINESFRKKEK